MFITELTMSVAITKPPYHPTAPSADVMPETSAGVDARKWNEDVQRIYYSGSGRERFTNKLERLLRACESFAANRLVQYVSPTLSRACIGYVDEELLVAHRSSSLDELDAQLVEAHARQIILPDHSAIDHGRNHVVDLRLRHRTDDPWAHDQIDAIARALAEVLRVDPTSMYCTLATNPVAIYIHSARPDPPPISIMGTAPDDNQVVIRM